MKKRTWCYKSLPTAFEIKCDKCGGENITWSEYEHHIWCFDCEVDTKGTENLLSGPVPVSTAALLGINLEKVLL